MLMLRRKGMGAERGETCGEFKCFQIDEFENSQGRISFPFVKSLAMTRDHFRSNRNCKLPRAIQGVRLYSKREKYLERCRSIDERVSHTA